MKIDASELSEIERDALAEIANMGVSRAATSLRQIGRRASAVVGPCRQYRHPQDRGAAGRTRRRAEAGCGAAIVRGPVFRDGAADLSAKRRAWSWSGPSWATITRWKMSSIWNRRRWPRPAISS